MSEVKKVILKKSAEGTPGLPASDDSRDAGIHVPAVRRSSLYPGPAEPPRTMVQATGAAAKKPRLIKLVNRGPAGLLNKTRKEPDADITQQRPARPIVINKIAPSLVKAGLVESIEILSHDPMNARVHPDVNLEAIKESINTYGQVKPIVVRRDGNVVVAGNGTLAAAKSLGWTKIAVSWVEMTPAEAAGYGLADNRSAELASWDFVVMAQLEKMISEAELPMTGWSAKEIDRMRHGAFVEPPADFSTVDETLETQHTCPRCGYKFSGGDTQLVSVNGDGHSDEDETGDGVESDGDAVG